MRHRSTATPTDGLGVHRLGIGQFVAEMKGAGAQCLTGVRRAGWHPEDALRRWDQAAAAFAVTGIGGRPG